ncbi:lycopene cyclase domain-containing protein [Leifsonia sp. AG29]|uniref:lycopene cyclase domain-containing protein n=1 Tax=Leifsonia sp. AG29 TaxID=2598860 RepID=UPI00131B8809|nr:lycopene cyclase domain-containing protein [Leifsonia sp. AG29]
MTYLLIDLVFVVIAAAVLAAALGASRDRRALVRRWRAPWAVSAVVVLVLTAVFDNLMIGAGLMTYSEARISGLRVGLIPLEDFAYPLAGLFLLPGVWLLLRRRRS